MEEKRIQSKIWLFFFVLLLPLSSSALEVDREELESKADTTIDFINYLGPHDFVDTGAEIRGIGVYLGATNETGFFMRTYFNKYTVIHAVDPTVEDLKDADIFILDEKALVDHIRNLRWIIQGYLSTYYDYSQKDASLLATFITYYNAAFRKDIEYIEENYKEVVLKNVEPDKVGLSRMFDEWAGQSMLVIPLTEEAESREFGSLDSDELSEDRVIEDLRETEEDRAVEDRQDLVELKEREIEEEKEKIEEESKAIEEQEQKLQERKDKLEERKQELAEKEAELEKTIEEQEEGERETEQGGEVEQGGETAQGEASPGESDQPQEGPEEEEEESVEVVKAELEREQKQVEEEEQEIAQEEQKLEERKQELEEKRQEQEQREERVREEREQIAEDQQELIEEEEAAMVETEVFMLTSASSGGNTYRKFVMINKDTGEVVKESSLDSITSRRLETYNGSYLVIASNSPAHRLMLIDPESLGVKGSSSVEVHPDSFLLKHNNKLYTTVKQEGKWYVGILDQDLKLLTRSQAPVVPYSYLSISDSILYVQTDEETVTTLDPDTLAGTNR
jgi:hypothetical protein